MKLNFLDDYKSYLIKNLREGVDFYFEIIDDFEYYINNKSVIKA